MPGSDRVSFVRQQGKVAVTCRGAKEKLQTASRFFILELRRQGFRLRLLCCGSPCDGAGEAREDTVKSRIA